MDDARWGYIDAMMLIAEDFSDGAFWGFMQEKGIDTDEVVAWSEINEKRSVGPREDGGEG